MKQMVVAVRDSAADVFGRPYFVPTASMAIRSFSDEVNRESDDNPLYKHPSDFALYEIGSYEEEVGKLISLELPKLLIQADQCVKK